MTEQRETEQSLSDTLDQTQFQSQSSLEKIPHDLMELADDICHIAEVSYGGYAAINWHGSIPRGDFVFGESDADLVIITHEPLRAEQRVKREEMLAGISQKWTERGVPKLDVIAIGKEELHNDDRRSSLFFCFTDGIDLPGSEKLDLSFVLPTTRLELVTMLNHSFSRWIEDTNARGSDDLKAVEQLRKRSIRGMYGLAILEGAPYERSWRKYGENIALYNPRHSEDYRKLLDMSLSFEAMLTTAEMVAQELTEHGVEFH